MKVARSLNGTKCIKVFGVKSDERTFVSKTDNLNTEKAFLYNTIHKKDTSK